MAVCAINKIDSNISGLSYAEEECLKQLSTGTNPVAATGSIPLAVNPSPNDTVTIGGVVFTFLASAPGANDILIGANSTATAANAAAKIDALPNVISTNTTSTINITAAVPGAAGNAITLAASAATPSGATLTGGVDPTGNWPTWYGLEPNSYSDFGGQLSTVARAPIDPSRQNKRGTVTDLEASGGFNIDFTRSNLIRLLQGFFFADARQPPTTAPLNAAAVTVSSVTGNNTYNVASGGTAFTTGALIYVQGFVNAANNGLQRVNSSTNTTIVLSGSALVNETAPAGVTITVVGRRLNVSDGSITVSGRATFATATFNFTTIPTLIPGSWIYLGSDTSTNRFVSNNGYARIFSVSANALVLDDTTWTPVAEAGTGLFIEFYYGPIIKNESTSTLIKRRSYNIERTLGEGTISTQAEYLEGAVPNEFTLNIPQADKLNADLSFVACNNTYRSGDTGDTLKYGTRVAAPAQDAFNTSSDIYRIKMSILNSSTSAPSPLFGYVSEGTITLNNNVSPNKAVGVLGAFEASVGNFEVGGSLTVYFTTTAAVKAVRANSDVSLSLIVAAKNSGFIFDIPLLGLGGGRINVEKDAPITVPLETAAAQSQFGHTLLYQRFVYLPTVAMPA